MFSRKLFLLFVLFATTPALLKAQKPFVEGIVEYNISMGTTAGGVDMAKRAGTFIVTVKGKMIRKELKLDNGYENVIIYNGNTKTGYSLRALPDGRKYALQLAESDIMAMQEPYRNFSFTQEAGTMQLAGYTASKAKLTYKDGHSDDIYYVTEWSPAEPFVFDRYPGIKYYPLSFRYANGEGLVMIFEATKVSEQPVENGLFRLPQNYKIISAAEYKALNK
jgi:hypothetical protein